MEPTSQAQPPKRSFRDALSTPASPAPETPVAASSTDNGSGTAPDAAAADHKKKPHTGRNGVVVAGVATPKAKVTDGPAKDAEGKPKRIFAELPVKKVKKGGKVAMKAEVEAEAAAAAKNGTVKKAKKVPKSKKAEEAEEPADEEEDRQMVPFAYKYPKPHAITDALFMWELVAAFCPPKTAVVLERLCQDVAAHLQQSRKSRNLMQRYWNAQWAAMIWEDSQIPLAKRLLLPTSLTRSEGKINWKKMYKEEYPLWLDRTFAGVGANNNANNVAKVLFHHETLNESKPAAELARSELTLEEALQKAQRKRGVEVEINNESNDEADNGDGLHPKRSGGGSGVIGGGGPAVKGLTIRVPVHNPSAGFTRADYKLNSRKGTRKGKHMKGGDKKWGSYAALDDDDDDLY